MKAGLNRERIAQAAFQLLNRVGLAEFSMRKLGAELGVEAMSLYRYFPSKTAIYQAIVGVIIGQITLTADQLTGTWEAVLVTVARALRQTLCRFPNAVPLVAVQPLDPDNPGDHILALLQILTTAGFGEQTTKVIQTLAVFVIGHSLAEVGSPDPSAVPPEPNNNFNYDAYFEFGLDAFVTGLRVILPTLKSPR